MDLRMGSHLFRGVTILLLWGKRAIIQDKQERLSVIDLSGSKARIEVLGDNPAPGVDFAPTFSGFKIFENGVALYHYEPAGKWLQSLSLDLPDCEVTPLGIRVGESIFSNNYINVSSEGIGIEASLPPGLAKLVV